MFTTIDVVGLQRRGQDLYKHKEYKAAVEYFNIVCLLVSAGGSRLYSYNTLKNNALSPEAGHITYL